MEVSEHELTHRGALLRHRSVGEAEETSSLTGAVEDGHGRRRVLSEEELHAVHGKSKREITSRRNREGSRQEIQPLAHVA